MTCSRVIGTVLPEFWTANCTARNILRTAASVPLVLPRWNPMIRQTLDQQSETTVLILGL